MYVGSLNSYLHMLAVHQLNVVSMTTLVLSTGHVFFSSSTKWLNIKIPFLHQQSKHIFAYLL